MNHCYVQFAFAVCLFVVGNAPCKAQLNFGPERVIAEPSSVMTTEVETADMDNDGDQDIVLTSSVDGEVAIYENLGGGNFGAINILLSDAEGATGLAVGDIDGDGDIDIAFAAQIADRFAWIPNLGDLQFGPATEIVTDLGFSNCATGIRLADIDADGDLDAVTSMCAGFGYIQWWTNSDNGATWTINSTIGSAPSATFVEVGDINGDGLIDVAGGGYGIGWHMNDGTGFVSGPYGFGEIGDPEISSISIGSATPEVASVAIALRLEGTVSIGDYDFAYPYQMTGTSEIFQTVGSPTFVDHTPLGILVLSAGEHSAYLDGNSSPIIQEIYDPNDAAVADFDGDGDLDLAIACGSGCSLSWHENTENGFVTHCLAPLASGFRPPAVADLTGDGLPDIAVLQAVGLTQFNNLGAGEFGPGIPIDLNPLLKEARTADMDQDGDMDIVTISHDGNLQIDIPELKRLQWYPNNGNGSYGAPVILADSFPSTYFALADMDGDGDTDAVMAEDGIYDHLLWVENTGDGSPGDTTVFANATLNFPILAVDVDNDDDVDVIEFDYEPDVIVLYLNNGDGSVLERVQLDGVVFQSSAISVGDVTGDGITDLVFTNWIGDRVDMMPGLGGGSFGTIAPLIPSVDDQYSAMEIADLDGDGDRDLALALRDAGIVRLFENDGAGLFSNAVDISSDVVNGRYLTLTDVGGDGLADVLLTSSVREALVWFANGDITTEVTTRHMDDKLRVWPVPASAGLLQLSRVVSGTVYDAQGKYVLHAVRSNTILVDGLQSGVYCLRTIDGTTVRFVLE